MILTELNFANLIRFLGKLFGVALVLSFVSCQEIEKPKKPKNLIPKDKMVEVLYDITLLNAVRSYSPKIIAESDIDYRDYVYKKHEIDSVQFAQSSAWYSHRIDTYLAIYNQVEEKLVEQKRIWKDSLELEKKIQDSLAKIKKEQKEETTDSTIQKIPEKIKDSLAQKD